MSVCPYVCVSVYLSVCLYVCLSACRYACMHACMHVYITLHYITLQYNCVTLHCITLHSIPFHCIALQYSTCKNLYKCIYHQGHSMVHGVETTPRCPLFEEAPWGGTPRTGFLTAAWSWMVKMNVPVIPSVVSTCSYHFISTRFYEYISCKCMVLAVSPSAALRAWHCCSCGSPCKEQIPARPAAFHEMLEQHLQTLMLPSLHLGGLWCIHIIYIYLNMYIFIYKYNIYIYLTYRIIYVFAQVQELSLRKHPVGEKPRQRLERFEKMSFSPKRNYWFIPQNRLKIPRGIEMLFWWCPVIYREIVLEKVRHVFPSHIAMRFFKEWPVTSKRLLVLEFIQRHCHTLMLRINFRFTWRLVLVGRLHAMADFDSRHITSTPPVWIRTCFF